MDEVEAREQDHVHTLNLVCSMTHIAMLLRHDTHFACSVVAIVVRYRIIQGFPSTTTTILHPAAVIFRSVLLQTNILAVDQGMSCLLSIYTHSHDHVCVSGPGLAGQLLACGFMLHDTGYTPISLQ